MVSRKICFTPSKHWGQSYIAIGVGCFTLVPQIWLSLRPPIFNSRINTDFLIFLVVPRKEVILVAKKCKKAREAEITKSLCEEYKEQIGAL